MKVVLFHPQIPQNTGNIARTCVATDTELILVRPLGFAINDKMLKRAGLDYWEEVKLTIIDDLYAYLKMTSAPFYFFSSHAKKIYTDIHYTKESILIFGSETAGLPPIFKEAWNDKFVTIPIKKKIRCLNLATSVGIGLYEALNPYFSQALLKS
ncbi:MAG: tRNA (cytidine(34)-2'-O)-methyltransferase [Chlamydiota bacterium]